MSKAQKQTNAEPFSTGHKQNMIILLLFVLTAGIAAVQILTTGASCETLIRS